MTAPATQSRVEAIRARLKAVTEKIPPHDCHTYDGDCPQEEAHKKRGRACQELVNTAPSDLAFLLEQLAQAEADRDGYRNGQAQVQATADDLFDTVQKYGRAVDTLFDAIAHGDDAHRAWLKDAIAKHFALTPAPACASGGDCE